jgi:iron(III) transport system ATP-binding protein
LTTKSDATVVRLREVTKRFGGVEAVRDVSLEIRRGELLSLLGPSGCGKTTTLRLLAGFENPDGGWIEIDGRRVADGGSAPVPPEHRRVGMVFQDYALFPHLTVEKNVAYGLPRSAKRKNRIQEVLALTRLDGLGNRMPHELSGGQQQRVALARALAPEPALVLLDEPFSNLDAALRGQVRSEVREILTDAGATAVFVTHDQEEALSIADEVAVMLEGNLVQKAPPEELYHRPATREVAEFVGEANFLSGVAEGSCVRTALGEIECRGASGGEVEAMLRPEFVTLSKLPEQEYPGCEGTVVGREFYGHDQLIKVRLDCGVEVSSRLGPGPGFRVGSRVSVRAASPAVTYPGG